MYPFFTPLDMRTPFLVLGTMLLVGGLAYAGLTLYSSERPLDAAPVLLTSQDHTLPSGKAQVAFYIDTSGDQMSITKTRAGLGFIVHYGNTFQRQLFAHCEHAGIMGPASPVELSNAEALCDGDAYRMTVENGTVQVTKSATPRSAEMRYAVTLPADAREAVEYNQDLWKLLPAE